MSVTAQLKRIYNELPRPHHLVLHAARYEEVLRALPAPPTPDFHQPSLLDLQIYVGEIPRDEIHFVDRMGNVYKVERIAQGGTASPKAGS